MQPELLLEGAGKPRREAAKLFERGFDASRERVVPVVGFGGLAGLEFRARPFEVGAQAAGHRADFRQHALPEEEVRGPVFKLAHEAGEQP